MYSVHLPAIAWSVMETSTYSQKAYPFDRPVAESFTKLKALSWPNDVRSSLTWSSFK